MGSRRAAATAAALALAILAATAPTAAATFHLMQVREVYPGSLADPASEYVELQMWASGQNLVAGHVLRAFDASGAPVGTSSFPTDVPRGANQSTIVLATPQAEAQFGFAADAPLSPAGQLDPAGGAVCWESIDCVAWGSLAGPLPSPAGSPADPAGIPDGMALRRAIARGCATLLDPGDDSDDSAADFADVFPAPRPNSVPPTEHACAPPAGPLPPVGRAPQTVLLRGPGKSTRDRTPTFRFAADDRGAIFQCRLDRRRFRRCRSPFTSRRLAVGRHVFRVRARDPSGLVDPTPARYAFRVLRRRR